jgi:hypothetical protein
MIPRQAIGPFHQIYTWVRDDGKNFNISTHHLIEWINKTKPAHDFLPIDKSLVDGFIASNSISVDRIRQMMMMDNPPSDPIIMCLTGRQNINGIPGPEGMLVDGRHRYALYAACGLKLIPCYVIKKLDWQPFRISGMPRLTKQGLVEVPVLNHIMSKFQS